MSIIHRAYISACEISPRADATAVPGISSRGLFCQIPPYGKTVVIWWMGVRFRSSRRAWLCPVRLSLTGLFIPNQPPTPLFSAHCCFMGSFFPCTPHGLSSPGSRCLDVFLPSYIFDMSWVFWRWSYFLRIALLLFGGNDAGFNPTTITAWPPSLGATPTRALSLSWWPDFGSWCGGLIFARGTAAYILTPIPLILLREVGNAHFARLYASTLNPFDQRLIVVGSNWLPFPIPHNEVFAGRAKSDTQTRPVSQIFVVRYFTHNIAARPIPGFPLT